MSKGFFNGLFMGAITGALISMFLNPKLKPQHRKLSDAVRRKTRGLIKEIKQNRE